MPDLLMPTAFLDEDFMSSPLSCRRVPSGMPEGTTPSDDVWYFNLRFNSRGQKTGEPWEARPGELRTLQGRGRKRQSICYTFYVLPATVRILINSPLAARALARLRYHSFEACALDASSFSSGASVRPIPRHSLRKSAMAGHV